MKNTLILSLIIAVSWLAAVFLGCGSHSTDPAVVPRAAGVKTPEMAPPTWTADEILGRFVEIPSKENGVDIEGIAVSEGVLYLGFRGPVLRGNFAPVMVLDFEEPDDYDLRFVNLDGRGIRDIVAVEGGFLLIGGPIGDGLESYVVYFWDGKDCVPGDGSPQGKVASLGTLPSTANVKPEGIAVTAEDEDGWDIVLVCDGADVAKKFHVPRP